MCGITGWAGSPDLSENALARMCASIAHRGPDDDGRFVDPGKVALGFRRLSIIDLKGGAQPIRNETGRIAVTVNGEIYNFQALRRGLEQRGHSFSTDSDAEVVVHLYEEHGVDCLSWLRGMFAIALWDSDSGRLFLARDRLGVKPLYYAEVAGGLLYGSEPGAILASGAVRAEPDLAAIAQYLALQYVPAPLSGFTGIRKLHPGEYLVWQGGSVRRDRWWSIQHVAASEPATEAECLDRLDELMSEATRLRLIADVPVGAFLSGGIDSSLVISYMAEHASDVRTFSIDFPHARFSEGMFAREVAAVYGTRHEDLTVDPDIIPTIAATVQAAGEPFADSSAIPTFLLSEMTRRRVTVALSGDGGDEAFAGYIRHRLAVAGDQLGPLPQLARPLAGALGRVPGNGRLARLKRGALVMSRSSQERYAAIMSHFDPDGIERLCTSEFLVEAGGSRRAWDEVLRLPSTRGVNRYLDLDTTTYLPGDLLLKVDRMSMAYALEVRSPLLDHEIHEFAARTPAKFKLRRGQTNGCSSSLRAGAAFPSTWSRGPRRALASRWATGSGMSFGPGSRTCSGIPAPAAAVGSTLRRSIGCSTLI